jgi:inhibitor of growth protein 3
MPVARGQTHPRISMAITTMEPLVPIADGDETPVEAEGDGDEKTYCYCDTVSYGEMIACDDSGCEREWVRFFFLLLYFV